MKHLLDLIRSERASGLNDAFQVYAAVFFNARGSKLETSPEGFMRSVIIQILQQKPELFCHIEEDYLGSKKQISEALVARMLKVLVRECSLTSRLGLLVDALDECDGPIREQLYLFQELIEISRKSGYLMSICVSGRPAHTLTAWLGHYPQLTLEDHTSVDIATYVLAKTSRLSSTTDAYMYEQFRQDIMKKSKGVFLWVVLVIEELLDAWEASEPLAGLRMKLAAIPENLDDFFGRMLRKVPASQFPETVAVFKCVLAALRPLTLKELRVALAFGSDDPFESIAKMRSSDRVVHGDEELERRIQSCCGGLIEVTKNSLTVQAIHQTVLDYLLAQDRLQSLLAEQSAFTLAHCHQYQLQACIRYLSLSELKKPFESEDFEFLSYSLLHWVDHYIGAEQEGDSQAWNIEEFVRPEYNHFHTWYRLYCQLVVNEWHGTNPPFLSFAAEHNLLGYVKDYINRNPVSSTDTGEFGGPVQAAAISGNLEMVRLLLDHGVDVNARGGRFGTAIAAAITFQNHEMIDLLCDYGANVQLQPPGSPLLESDRWVGHRCPFSRSRMRHRNDGAIEQLSFRILESAERSRQAFPSPPLTFIRPSPDNAEMTDVNTMSDRDYQIYVDLVE